MGAIKNVQRGTFTEHNFDDTQTFTVSISPVNTSKAVLVLTHVMEYFCTINQISLTNGTTISIKATAGTTTQYNDLVVSWQVVEYV